MPKRLEVRTSWARHAALMNALLGTQPVHRQSPPGSGSRSINATRAPSAAATRAPVSPALPPPTMAMSYTAAGCPDRCAAASSTCYRTAVVPRSRHTITPIATITPYTPCTAISNQLPAII